MAYCLLAPFFLFVLAWPYLLFLEARRLDTPVKEFAYRFGREDVSMLPMLMLYNGAAAFLLYTAVNEIVTRKSTQDDSSMTLLFISCLMVLPFLAIAFIVNRLHYDYWRHEHHTRLKVDELQQQVVYTNQDQQLIFVVSEVISIVRYSASQYRRAPWNGQMNRTI